MVRKAAAYTIPLLRTFVYVRAQSLLLRTKKFNKKEETLNVLQMLKPTEGKVLKDKHI